VYNCERTQPVFSVYATIISYGIDVEKGLYKNGPAGSVYTCVYPNITRNSLHLADSLQSGGKCDSVHNAAKDG